MIRSHGSVTHNRNIARNYYGFALKHEGDTFVFHSMAPRSYPNRGIEDIWLTNGRRFIGVTLDINTDTHYVIRIYGPINHIADLEASRLYDRRGIHHLPSENWHYTSRLRVCDDVVSERQLVIP